MEKSDMSHGTADPCMDYNIKFLKYKDLSLPSSLTILSPKIFFWKQIIEGYNEVRACLLNSQSLLEETNLVLFPINEATLSKWHKGVTRMNEVKMLLQGLPKLPPPRTTAAEPLLPALERYTSPPPPPDNPHIFPEAEDRRGMAHVRSAAIATVYVPTSDTPPCDVSTSPPVPMATSNVTVSRTTEWRRRKKMNSSGETLPPSKKPRKDYTCRVCNETMSTG